MKIKVVFIAALVLVYLASAGCAAVPSRDGEAELPEISWWTARFKLQWPEQQEPEFFYHIFIADRILRPVIRHHDKAIELWRFHRRAARDNAGNQFSFIFYTDEQTAKNINAEIESNETLSLLLQESVVESVSFMGWGTSNQSGLATTSDSVWPPEIQQSWPYFIMGASQSWLEQIKIIGEKIEGQNDDTVEMGFEDTSAYYRKLEQELSAQWTQYGRHAYFHHLNALYGYVPVYMREFGELWRF